MVGPERAALTIARDANRRLLYTVGFYSGFLNLLMLTGPVFMLQVYDRVLGSGSRETLLALVLITLFLFTIMGLLDLSRGRIMTRLAARIQAGLERRVFPAVMARSAIHPGDAAAAIALRDVEAIRQFLTAPVVLALLDIPWAPIFLAGMFVFHPWLGWAATAGGTLLIAATVLHQRATRHSAIEAAGAAQRAEILSEQLRTKADQVPSLAMADTGYARWVALRSDAQSRALAVSDVSGMFTAFSRTLRLFLQSAILAIGALLVLNGELAPGAMIVASILMGRALAPIDQAISGWPIVQRAQEGWRRIEGLLAAAPVQPHRIALPRPRAAVEAQQLTIIPPGQTRATLRMVSFRLEPGQALGIIGASGAGKSTVARAVTGLWQPAGGWIRLDGASLDQYAPDQLARHVGYLPQSMELFDGTIAENIARLSWKPDEAAVIAAARKANAHEMIIGLPEGYGTRVTHAGTQLSGGQIQRIGLARALYGDPAILVLDEPNSNLDNDGSSALNAVIRAHKAEGGAVIILAHRPAAIQECDLLMVLENGLRHAFGPRDEVLGNVVRDAGGFARKHGLGGVA